MEFFQIKGNTYCLQTTTGTIPFYQRSKGEIILLDSGLKNPDRPIWDAFLAEQNLRVVGMLATHTHIDHTGNFGYLQKKYAAPVAMPALEAQFSASLLQLKVYYYMFTEADVKKYLSSMICRTNIEIGPEVRRLQFCGAEFQIVPTPGHSPAHIAILTPDNVAYLGDSLAGEEEARHFKLPCSYSVAEDFKSKEMLKGLSADKYVIAHHGVYEEIQDLIDLNIREYQRIIEQILKLVTEPICFDDLFAKALGQFQIHADQYYKFKLLERNLRSFLFYLRDQGRLEMEIQKGQILFRQK